ncbi:hypothetical protein HZC07_04565, partial [Candidatus Micrarchaeota archaeon]|nr:hypothetical protein [Candidatus Micrarchaeota archaeon]
MLKRLFLALLIVSLSVAANIDVKIQNLSCPANASFIQVLYKQPTCIVETFFTTLVSGLVYSAKEFLQNSLDFIIGSPNIKLFCSPYTKVMNIIESLYTIALMGVGAYYVAASADPQQRAKAKLWIQNILFMIILLAFSFGIFGLMIDLNKYIATSLYNASFTNLLNINVSF